MKSLDLTYQTSTTTGTGNLVLLPVEGFQQFPTDSAVDNLFCYGIRHVVSGEYEIGLGYLAGGLVRHQVLKSSNGDALVNFAAGQKDVVSDVPAELQNILFSEAIQNTQEAFTTALKSKLDGIQAGAEVNSVDSVAGRGGDVVLTKSDVGLSNVDNTTDANKPISSATQTALNAKANLTGATFLGAISATNLSGTNTGDQDLSGYLTISGAALAYQPLSSVLTNTTASFTTALESKISGIEAGADVTDATNVAAAGAVMESDYSPAHSILVQQSGTGSPTALQIGNNTLLGRLSGGGSDIGDLSASDVRTLLNVENGAQVNTVNSVAGKTGVVTLVKGDVGLGNVDNTSDLNKPISTATQTALDAKQPLATVLTNTTASYTTEIDTRIANTSGTNTGDQTNISGNAETVTTINGRITAGANVSITGAGTSVSPYEISASGASSISGSVVIDFGAYGYATKVSVADALVTATTKIMVSLASPAAGRDDDELEFNPICVAAVAKNGVGFDIYATAPIGADGQFNVNYTIGGY